MLPIKKSIAHYTNRNICDYVFNKYLNTKIYVQTKHEKHRVYDSLGMIDTLGHDYNKGINHFSYSDEGGCLFGILINKKWFVYVNFDTPEVYVFNECPTNYYFD